MCDYACWLVTISWWLKKGRGFEILLFIFFIKLILGEEDSNSENSCAVENAVKQLSYETITRGFEVIYLFIYYFWRNVGWCLVDAWLMLDSWYDVVGVGYWMADFMRFRLYWIYELLELKGLESTGYVCKGDGNKLKEEKKNY